MRSSASAWPGTEGTWAEAGQFDVEKLQNGSARVSFPALPAPELLAAAIELSAPIAALATKRAITSPLMNRKAALGLSRSRRPAISVEGRLARFAMSRAPAVVNHGPARHQPHDQEHEAREQLEKLAADGARLASGVEVREHGDTGEQRDDPYDPRWAGRRSPLHAERRYLDPAKREASGHNSGDRDADHGEHDVDPAQREVAFSEGRSGERHVVEQRSEGEEECEADCDARDRRDHCLHRGDHRNLTRRGADEAHRGEALLAPRGRQSAGGRDQDQHGQQERDGSAGQDELQNGSAPDGALAGVAVGRRALDGSDFDRTRCLRELARGVADDDDQRVRGRQRRCADGPDLPARKPVPQLIRRFGPKKGREGGRGEVATRSWQVGEALGVSPFSCVPVSG